MSSPNRNWYFVMRTDLTYHFLYFIVDHVHSVTVSVCFFICAMSILFNEILCITEVKMTEQQNVFASEKIIALDIKKRMQKRDPHRISTTRTIIGPDPNVLRYPKHDIPGLSMLKYFFQRLFVRNTMNAFSQLGFKAAYFGKRKDILFVVEFEMRHVKDWGGKLMNPYHLTLPHSWGPGKNPMGLYESISKGS